MASIFGHAEMNSRLSLSRPSRPRLALFVVLLTVLQVVVLFPVLPSPLHVRQGDIASQTIRASRPFTYNSDVLRRQAQDQARQAVPESFSYDVSVRSSQLTQLDQVIATIFTARIDPSLPPAQLVTALATREPQLSADQRAEIAAMSATDWQATADAATTLLGVVLEQPFSAGDLNSILASLPNRLRAGLTTAQSDIAVALARPLVVPTEKLDDVATQKARDLAAAAVPAQPVTYARNQVIVREGDVIDESKREALQDAGLLTVRVQYNQLGAVALLALIGSALLAAYLWSFRPEVLTSLKPSLLLCLVVAGTVLLARIYMPLILPDSQHQFLEFAFPTAAAPMLVASLFDAGLAVGVAGLAAVLVTFAAIFLPQVSGVVGLSGLQQLELVAAAFFGGVAGVLVVNRAERFNRFIVAGAAIALTTACVLFGFWLLEPVRAAREAGWIVLASGLNGLASCLLTVGTFVLLGSVFNVSTRLQLMELAQLNQPLLRRLQEEAPGTFHHSILVGNLGERAADLIGADALLVRVGCYYHDIGKLSRPGFFIENQLSGENPHDALEPEMSNRIVQDHVRHGQELARKYRLPDRVRDFTVEHHGTRLVAYFYRKAAEVDPDIDPARFSYPGPRPRSRETAIAMLADSCEAIVRASSEHSPARIDDLVEGVIAERLAEGQFDDCDLTLKQLRTIAESFKYTLRAIYHPRIEYPRPTAAELSRRERRALDPPRAPELPAIVQAELATAPEPAEPAPALDRQEDAAAIDSADEQELVPAEHSAGAS